MPRSGVTRPEWPEQTTCAYTEWPHQKCGQQKCVSKRAHTHTSTVWLSEDGTQRNIFITVPGRCCDDAPDGILPLLQVFPDRGWPWLPSPCLTDPVPWSFHAISICLRSLWMAKSACGLRFWHTLEEETTRIYQAQGLDRLDVNFYDITSIKFKTLSPPDPRYQQTSMTSQLTEMPQRSAKNVKVALAWVQGMNRLDCTLVAKYSKQNTKMFPQHRKRRVWAPAMSSRSPICSRKATTSGEDRPVRAKQRLEGARKRESISSTCPINFQFNIYIYTYIYNYIYIYIYI